MEYVQMTINDWLEVKHKLKMELQGVKQSFVRIGYALRKIDDQRLYENDGYKSIAEFAKGEYGLEASTVSRFMSINREYSIDGYSEHLREEYLDMGRSQLEEMLKLPEPDRQMIRPETSREDIRGLKRFNKTEPAAGVADDVLKLIEKFYEDNPDILNAVFTEEADFQDTLERKIEIVNPGGNRSYKKGLFFLMMYEDSIKIKKFGSDPQTMSWSEFFDITVMIFGEAAAGPFTWKNYFEGDTDERREYEEKNSGGGSTVAGTTESVSEEGEGSGGTSEEPGNDTESDAGVGDDREDTMAAGVSDGADYTGTGTAEDDSGADEEGTDAAECSEEPNAEKTREKTEEKVVAPAQESPEILEKKEPESAIGKVIESIEKGAFEQAMNPPEIVEKPFGTRKDYIDSLTEYGAAIYFAEEYKRHNLKASSLAYPTELEKWLMEEVDEKGYSMNVEGENHE